MLAAVGISHRTAGQDVRDKAAFTASSAAAFRAAAAGSGATAAVVLSTCNRSEVFACVPDADAARDLLALYVRTFPAADGKAALRTGREAAEYMFRVAAGLESMVVGEDQILGQFRDAFETSLASGATDREMNVLAQCAISCAKRIKTSVSFSAPPEGVAAAGVAHLERVLGGVAGLRALVIGRGRVATMAADLLRRACADVAVCNRTGGEGVIDYSLRYAEIARADIVASATSSPHYAVVREKLPPGASPVFLDLASPRDVEPGIPRTIALDDIAAALSPSRTAAEASARAQAIVAEAVDAAISKAEGPPDARYVIGTRGSRLAMIQAENVKRRLEAAFPGDTFAIRPVSTRGDRERSRSIAAIGDGALFTRDIERELLDGKIDLAVHSMKDLPATLPDGLVLADAWEREDPRDALVLKSAKSLSSLPPGATVATGSVRRTELLRRVRPDLNLIDIRGNVDTRLRKLFEPSHGERRLDGLCLAAAGLKRLGREDAIAEYLDPQAFVPAPAQGTLAIELRAGDARLRAMVDSLSDAKSALAAKTERAFLRATGGNCREPVGAFATVADGGEIVLRTFWRGRFATVRGRDPEAVAKEAACRAG